MCKSLTFRRFATIMFFTYHILLGHLWYLVPHTLLADYLNWLTKGHPLIVKMIMLFVNISNILKWKKTTLWHLVYHIGLPNIIVLHFRASPVIPGSAPASGNEKCPPSQMQMQTQAWPATHPASRTSQLQKFSFKVIGRFLKSWTSTGYFSNSSVVGA